MENRNCQNCKTDFAIDADDFAFYDKIGVPAPTWCPECRMIRRMIWRNARSLHKRSCNMCNKGLISMYAEESVPVICSECYNGTEWNPMPYGKDYDFSRPFFDQLRELWQTVPRLYAYRFGNLINSDYCNFAKDDKNCYLSFSVVDCEDILYSETIDYAKNSIDALASQKIDGCSYNIDCDGNYNTHYAVKTQSSVDSYFLFDCSNCTNCCLSANLRNAQYVFKNEQLSKEDYQQAVADLHLETYSGWQKTRKAFDEMVKQDAIHKYAFVYATENSTGDYLHHVKNAKRCFDTNDAENVAYSNRAIDVKDCYDNTGVGFKAELIYESMAATANTSRDSFCYLTIQGCRNCEYSMILRNCNHCFGCVGLINANYCIFNKQYTEEEYFELLPKIKQHMMDMPYVDKLGRVFKYGEFFPYDMCPFGYNESNSHDFFPITKDEALAQGFPWFDRPKRDYATTINSTELPDSIREREVDDSILSQTIGCANDGDPHTRCASAYRIIPEELQFYKAKNLPLPRHCPNCRHYDRLSYRNPMRLYTRSCMNNCGREFDTTYPSNHSEKVFCESCYQQTVL